MSGGKAWAPATLGEARVKPNQARPGEPQNLQGFGGGALLAPWQLEDGDMRRARGTVVVLAQPQISYYFYSY